MNDESFYPPIHTKIPAETSFDRLDMLWEKYPQHHEMKTFSTVDELSLFHAVRELYPDTLYQYRPQWLGRQSLDLYIPSLMTAIEHQGVQHYLPVPFFGGKDALERRQGAGPAEKETL